VLVASTMAPREQRGPPVRAFLFLAVGVLSVGAAAILVRLAEAHPLTACFARLSIGAAVLVAAAAARGRAFPRGRDAVRAVVAGVLLAAHFALWIGSLSLTTVTASVVLVCLQPVFVAVGGVVILRERVTATVAAGIGIALVGAVVIATDGTAAIGGGQGAPLGNALALAGAVAIAAYVLALRGQRSDVLATAAMITSTAALATLPAVLLADAPLWPSSSTSALWLLALALGPQVVGHTALNAALRHLPAAVVSGSILLEPVMATALAFIVLHEAAGIQTLIGSVITLVGVVLLLRPTTTS
jgi:drug/metabolite transporter (DMT)-like permease